MARKQAVYVTCDLCKKPGEVENLNDLPEGWYHIAMPNNMGKMQPTANGFDFCTLICIERWAKARRMVLSPGKHGRRYEKNKCEFCDKEYAPQGMRLHVAEVHPEIFADWVAGKKAAKKKK